MIIGTCVDHEIKQNEIKFQIITFDDLKSTAHAGAKRTSTLRVTTSY